MQTIPYRRGVWRELSSVLWPPVFVAQGRGHVLVLSEPCGGGLTEKNTIYKIRVQRESGHLLGTIKKIIINHQFKKTKNIKKPRKLFCALSC